MSESVRPPVPPQLTIAFPLAVEVGSVLNSKGCTVAVAESCTGGLLGAALTAVPGSSRYVVGGVIAYSDSVKESLLGVPRELLQRCGAVSAEVATAMADGVRRVCGANVGLSVTGVAGPAGGSIRTPVGLVFVAADAGAGVRVRRLEGDRGREANRARAVEEALRLCLEALRGQ